MSGETEKQRSAWKTDTLKEYFDSLRQSDQDRLNALRESDQIAIRAALDAAEKAVTAALNAADRATSKADAADEKRFAAVNEFRGQQQDLIRNFVTRDVLDQMVLANSNRFAELNREQAGYRDFLGARIDEGLARLSEKAEAAAANNAEKIETLQSRLDRNDGRGIGSGATWAYVIAIGGMILSAALIFVAVYHH